jgi:predicted transglutaminase-like cysteine proteinase
MEQGATAPAVPAASRIIVRGLGLALACALGFQAAVPAASAEDGLPGIANLDDYVQVALLAATPMEELTPELHFTPAPVARSVTAGSIAPVRAVPTAKPAARVAALPKTLSKDAKPTLLLGSLGKPVSLTPVTRRWTRALNELNGTADAGDRSRHDFRAYTAILEKVRGERSGRQIPKVNYMVNRLLAYRDDIRLWQSGEYWASPVESLTRRAGDCEDYAILKYALLRDLGVADADMRIVVLRDTAARQHHAVLSVRHNGKWLILDNRFSRVRFERDLPHYQVLYTVNAAGEWSHVPEKGTPVRLAARLKSATR